MWSIFGTVAISDGAVVSSRGEVLHDRNGDVLGWYHILRIID